MEDIYDWDVNQNDFLGLTGRMYSDTEPDDTDSIKCQEIDLGNESYDSYAVLCGLEYLWYSL